MYKFVTSANDDADTRFEDLMSSIKDDFDYLLDTLDKIERDSSREQAITYASEVLESINKFVDSCVKDVSKE